MYRQMNTNSPGVPSALGPLPKWRGFGIRDGPGTFFPERSLSRRVCFQSLIQRIFQLKPIVRWLFLELVKGLLPVKWGKHKPSCDIQFHAGAATCGDVSNSISRCDIRQSKVNEVEQKPIRSTQPHLWHKSLPDQSVKDGRTDGRTAYRRTPSIIEKKI